MDKTTLERLESLGPEAVLQEIAQGKHGQPSSAAREAVEAWLRVKVFERDAETLKIARSTKTLLIIAIVVNAITAITAALIAGILSYSSSSPIKFSNQSSTISSDQAKK